MKDKLLIAAQINRALTKTVEGLNLPDSEAMELADLYEAWSGDKLYCVDKLLAYGCNDNGETQLWRVLQEHTSHVGWEPGAAPALYKRVGFTDAGIPVWAQPLGTMDAYAMGDIVEHKEKLWMSDLDGNVWEPGIYGWTEQI